MTVTGRQNWFDTGGQAYVRFRPEYPPQLAAYLAGVAPNKALAVDVGCGNGQLTVLLTEYFERTIGLDSSADQIEHAVGDARLTFQRAAAESLPLADGSASIITAAQAAHWFDLPAFYAEVRRIAQPGAVVALVSYGVPVLDALLNDRFRRFYSDEAGPYWPPERQLVDRGYADIGFPFSPLAAPQLRIDKAWSLPELLGYVCTWSAVRRIKDAGHDEILAGFADDMAAMWGDPAQARSIHWPINMRIGTV